MLEVSGLNAFYGRAHILHGVSFSMAPGEAVALLGRNGAGKSTLLRSLIGLVRPGGGAVRPGGGAVRLDGVDMAAWPPHRIARAGLGYVPEERRIFTELTVEENLETGRLPPRPGLRPWTKERLFAQFPNLAALRGRPGGRISGGEQQMLTIARTLMGNPRLVLMDEPAEGLAPLVVQQVVGAIRALQADGVAVLLAEPNLRTAAQVASRALVLERGRLAWAGTVAALQADTAARQALLAV